MIIKHFEINKLKFDKHNYFLVYGENEGLKKEIIQTLKKKIQEVLKITRKGKLFLIVSYSMKIY